MENARDDGEIDGERRQARTLSACLAFLATAEQRSLVSLSLFQELEAAVRACSWADRNLLWHDASRPQAIGIATGFRVGELFPWNSQDLNELPPWHFFVPSPVPLASPDFVICASALSSEAHYGFAAALLQHVLAHLEASAPELLARVGGVGVVMVSASAKLPMMTLPRGIEDLYVRSSACTEPDSPAVKLVCSAGLVAIPDALGASDVAPLRRLVANRVHDAKTAIATAGGDIGSGDYCNGGTWCCTSTATQCRPRRAPTPIMPPSNA
jgi:hypothetical protein